MSQLQTLRLLIHQMGLKVQFIIAAGSLRYFQQLVRQPNTWLLRYRSCIPNDDKNEDIRLARIVYPGVYKFCLLVFYLQKTCKLIVWVNLFQEGFIIMYLQNFSVIRNRTYPIHTSLLFPGKSPNQNIIIKIIYYL